MIKIILVAGLALPTFASASTFIIPDLSRDKRNFHGSAAASGWSTRKTVGVNALAEESEADTDNIKTEEMDGSKLAPFVFYRTDFGLTAEFEYLMESEDEKGFNPSTAKDKTESNAMDMNLGYLLPNIPLSIGFGYDITELTEKDGGTGDKDKTDTASYELSASYKLESNWYVGAGVVQDHNEEKPATGGKTKDKDEQFYFGVGYIKGEMDKPEFAGEVSLMASNEEGQKIHFLNSNAIIVNDSNLQLLGRALLVRYDGDIDGSFLILHGAIDYQTGDFYIAPSASLSSSNIEINTGTEQDGRGSELRFEAGYRKDGLMAYAFVALTGDEIEQKKPAPKIKQETDGSQFGGGLSYNF